MQSNIIHISRWQQRKREQQCQDAETIDRDINSVVTELSPIVNRLAVKYGDAETLGGLLNISYRQILQHYQNPDKAAAKMRELIQYTITILNKRMLKG